MRFIHNETTRCQNLAVYDTDDLYGERGRFRVLQFADGDIQGAVDLDRPERIVLEYPRAMIHLIEHNAPSFETLFIVGHGVGTIASYFAAKRCTVAEWDERVVEVSRTYFGYDQDNVHIGDGADLLKLANTESLDYLILDAFSEQGTPPHLVSPHFFELANEKLDPDSGALLLNLIGSGKQDRHLEAIHSELERLFAYTKLFVLPTKTGSTVKQNMILMGSNRPINYQARQMAGFVEIN